MIEVSRSYQDVRRLLGQHFWGGPKGILNRPGGEDNYSAIFFNHYTAGRQVEKHGMNCIFACFNWAKHVKM